MPMKEGTPMKSEGMQGGGMMMGKMKDMHGKMGEMKKTNATNNNAKGRSMKAVSVAEVKNSFTDSNSRNIFANTPADLGLPSKRISST